MGLWGAICSVGSAIGSAISSVGSAICSGISSICSGIGGTLFSGIGGIASIASGLLAPIAGLSLPGIVLAITAVCKVISAVVEALGMKDKEETIEEMGMKAEIADKKPEDFDSTQAYIEYLRKEIKIDKEKVEKLSDEDKVKYGTIGSALYIKGMEEKYDMKMSPEFWTTISKMDMKGEEVKAYIDTFKAHDIKDMKDMTAYIERNPLSEGTSRKEISSVMMETLSILYPELSEDELADKLFAMEIPKEAVS